jgi:hypothetical protein
VLFRKICTSALLITFLAACGGGNQSSSSSAASPGAAGSPGAMSTAGAMNAASPGGNAMQGGGMQGGGMQGIASRPQAPIPASLNCGAVQPVWVNPRSRTFFESSAPFYGRTRNGSYMCPSAAVAAGYHAASGRRRHKRGGKGGSMQASPGTAPSPAST